MANGLVRMYLDSPTRLCRLEKVVEFETLPRVDEFLKVANRELGDYFPFRVVEITHRENALPEMMLGRLPPGEGKQAAFGEMELDEYVQSYVAEGWRLASTGPNRDAK